MKYLSSIIFIALCAKVIILGGGIAEALSLSAVCTLIGYEKYLSHKKELMLSKKDKEELEQKINELRNAVDSVKLGQSINTSSIRRV